ncbi:lipid-A-disaccharide synthase [Candidatus Omnitrophota bacterium]
MNKMANKQKMNLSNGVKNILIIAGEASSDMHAASLVNKIKSIDPNINFFGLGGDKMKNAGVSLLHNIVGHAFIGPTGLFKHYFALKKILNSLCDHLNKNIPDCAILIDYAEFNLRVARHLKSLGVPIIYYISPQVWAWGLWRINTIEKLINKMLVLFKFEEELYKKHGIDVSFVGHPVLDMAKPTKDISETSNELKIDKNTKVIGMLPGSRESEIKKILPIMLESAKLILKKLPEKKIRFLLPMASTVKESHIKQILDKGGVGVTVVRNDTYNALSVCDGAMVASGTATLETAIIGVPMAIIYKVNIITYILTRSVIKLPYIGLVNVVAGEKIVPEFLQYQANPEKISDYIVNLLEDKALIENTKKRFLKIKESLGHSEASAKAAQEVVNFLNNK